MKKFTFLLENDQFAKNYDEVTSQIKELVENTINNVGGEYDQFLDSILKQPDEVFIEGLIDDSDINDFYIKNRSQVDRILGDIKFYDQRPDELNVSGLNDYVLVGTKTAITEFVRILKEGGKSQDMGMEM